MPPAAARQTAPPPCKFLATRLVKPLPLRLLPGLSRNFWKQQPSPSQLQKYLKTQHPNRQNKSKAFFEASLHDKQKQVSLLEIQVKSANKDLVLASLKMAHVVMKRKRLYTELKSVILSVLKLLLTFYMKEKSRYQSEEKNFPIRQQN